jgi:subtilisin family serine protease
MNKKIVGILVIMLMISTALQTAGSMNKSNIPNDPDFDKQWHLYNTGQYGGTIDADIDAPEAWDIEIGSSDIIIAIIDSGVDYTHPDLENNIWINDDEIPDNGIDDDENGYIDDVLGWDWCNDDNDPLDDLGHGTMCAGIASAVGNNNIGVSGVCWNCKIMPLKIIDDTISLEFDIDDLASAIEYAADNGAKVISISLENYIDNTNLKNAVDYAYDTGVVLVTAAGNYNTSNEHYPASYDNVIAAGGTDHNDNRMNFYIDIWFVWIISNYGSWVDIAAPGYNVYTTLPSYHVTYNDYGIEQNYDYGGGTSSACPNIAGVAALLLSRDSTLSPEEVKNIICENADPYNSEYYIGTGRINAYKALNASNNPPEKPDPPTGEISCKTGEEYIYYASTTDPEGDDIFYLFDWGNGEASFIMGPYESGLECNASNIWFEKDDYEVKVQAIDEFGAESEWSDPIVVSMPKTKTINQLILIIERFLEKFPVLKFLLNQF